MLISSLINQEEADKRHVNQSVAPGYLWLFIKTSGSLINTRNYSYPPPQACRGSLARTQIRPTKCANLKAMPAEEARNRTNCTPCLLIPTFSLQFRRETQTKMLQTRQVDLSLANSSVEFASFSCDFISHFISRARLNNCSFHICVNQLQQLFYYLFKRCKRHVNLSLKILFIGRKCKCFL